MRLKDSKFGLAIVFEITEQVTSVTVMNSVNSVVIIIISA